MLSASNFDTSNYMGKRRFMGFFDFVKKKPQLKITFEAHEPSPKELAEQRQCELHNRVIEIRELIKNSIPSKNGLRPHEIFMLSYAPFYTNGKTDFPQFWYYDFAIDNPRKLLESLLKRGFIREATAKESVEKLKVAELKKILIEQGIKATGKKGDLVATVRENVCEEDLSVKIPVRRYTLTALGEQELSENEYVTYFGHSVKYGLTVWDMNRMLQDYPHKLFRDKIWVHLNQQVQESAQTLQRDGDLYSFYCREVSANYEMCDFLLEEKRSPLDALRLWSAGFYYDILIRSAFKFKLLLDTEKFNDGPIMTHMKDPNTGESVLVEDNSPPQFRDSLFLEYKVGTVKGIQEQLGFTNKQLFQQLVQFLNECQAIDYEHLNRVY